MNKSQSFEQPKPPRQPKTGFLLSLLLLILLVLTAFVIWFTQGSSPATTSAQNPGSIAPSAGAAAVGGPFTLMDQNGKTVQDSQFRGKLMLVFFGFTHCPDICPTTLGTISNVMTQLGNRASEVAPVFISVDPKRDTPERLKDYLAAFHPSIVGLTGTPEQVAAAASAYKVYFAEAPMDPSAPASGGHGHPMINHSSIVYLMGKKGEYLTHFSHQESELVMIETIQKYLR